MTARRMTRFERDYRGDFGEYWKNDAQKQIAKMIQEYESGQLVIEADGAGRWKSSGHYIPDDCAVVAVYAGIPIDRDATKRARDRQNAEFFKSIKPREYSAEEMAEMRNAFGAGAEVVNVLTGQRFRV